MNTKETSLIIEGKTIYIPAMGDGWIAVDKPTGISVHNTPGKDLCSLLSDAIGNSVELQNRFGCRDNFRIFPVNRIDKETSGIVLFGLNKAITAFMGKQFEARSVRKSYIALIHGNPATGNGYWEMPLTKKSGGRKNPAGSGKKVPCKTRYEIIDRSEHYTLIRCEPVTGRKHQIRRHAKLNKTPVTGDTIYGSEKSIRFLREKCDFHRMGLHARELVFRLQDGRKQVVSTPIPESFIRMIEADR